jgi:hypothetical protein
VEDPRRSNFKPQLPISYFKYLLHRVQSSCMPQGGWREASYSLIPQATSSASEPTSSTSASPASPAMGLLGKAIPLGDRPHAQATRVNSEIEEVLLNDPTIYRVYTRRWIGVIIIVLLNIVFSWGYVLCYSLTRSWIAFAPVANLTVQYFGLSSTTPVNWLSTVVLFVYCIVSPLSIWIYHRHSVRTGVILLCWRLTTAHNWGGFYGDWIMAQVCRWKSQQLSFSRGRTNHLCRRTAIISQCCDTLQR